MGDERNCVSLMSVCKVEKWSVFGIKPYLFSLIEFRGIFVLLVIYFLLSRLKILLLSIQIINSLSHACLPNLLSYIMLLSSWNISSFPTMLFSQVGISFHPPPFNIKFTGIFFKAFSLSCSLSVQISSPLNSYHTLNLCHDF